MEKIKRKPMLGLALGGGGARGLAHIGVLKVLYDEGFKPDMLAGTSMGAIIAVMAGLGFSPEAIGNEAKETTKLTNLAKMIGGGLSDLDYAFSQEVIQDYFRKMFGGDKQFDDLVIPTALAAVDFYSALEVTLTSGSLVEAINASMALPGVIEPVEKDAMRLVDGGSLNNVPADLVRSMGAEVVIAVDVSPDVTDKEFWQEQKLPKIAEANWRNIAIMMANITKAKLNKADTDLVLHPEIPAGVTTLTGFNHIEEIISCGEKAARNALEEIRDLMKPRFSLGKPEIKNAEFIKL